MRPRHFFFRPSSPSPPPPKQNKTKQQQQNWRLLRRRWSALLWNVYAWVKGRKETGGDGPGAGEMKVFPCYTDSSIMSSKMRNSRHLRNQWHNAELTVKWHLTDRLLSPLRTYCFLGYLLLEPPWSPTQRSIFARCIAAQKQAELFSGWQWCSFIFSTRVNVVKQDGPKIYKYRRRNC